MSKAEAPPSWSLRDEASRASWLMCSSVVAVSCYHGAGPVLDAGDAGVVEKGDGALLSRSLEGRGRLAVRCTSGCLMEGILENMHQGGAGVSRPPRVHVTVLLWASQRSCVEQRPRGEEAGAVQTSGEGIQAALAGVQAAGGACTHSAWACCVWRDASEES